MIKRMAAALAGVVGLVLATTGCIPTLVGQSSGYYGGTIPDQVVLTVRPTGTPEDMPYFFGAADCWNGGITTRYSTRYNVNGMPASVTRTDAQGEYYLITVSCAFGETLVNGSGRIIRG